MIERLYIKDIQKVLPFRDRRTLKKWCRNNGVEIFCDRGSNRLFVIKAEFELAKNNKEIIKYLKNKYDETILSKILNADNNFLFKNNNTEKVSEYKPQGEHEKNFLNRLQNLNSTL